MLAAHHARVRAELERFGGTVEKFIGDAVVAVFGAPVVHEDDPGAGGPRRARDPRCRATRRMPSCGSRSTRARRSSRSTRGPPEGEGMVAGDVVNTAARIQSAAPVNGVLVGETTYRATAHVIEYREAAPIDGQGEGRARRRLGGRGAAFAVRQRRRAGAARGARRPGTGGRRAARRPHGCRARSVSRSW